MDGVTTRPPLPPETLHLTHDAGPFRMAMGLLSCAEADWIELDDRYPEEMAERRVLLAERHGEVFAAIPGSEAARAEVLDLLARHLPERHPGWFTRAGAGLRNHLTGETWDLDARACDPLELAGRLVQEDLCLLRPTPEGVLLEAAVLCAPSRWLLSEKIGRPLVDVHGPVPLYAERLGAPVDRFLRHIRPGRIAMRWNWSVVDDPALFQPVSKRRLQPRPPVREAAAGTELFYRIERQTLRLLERSGSVLFTIRVHSWPLERIARQPRAASSLAAALRALPPELQAYKGLPPHRDALLGYLDRAAVA